LKIKVVLKKNPLNLNVIRQFLSCLNFGPKIRRLNAVLKMDFGIKNSIE